MLAFKQLLHLYSIKMHKKLHELIANSTFTSHNTLRTNQRKLLAIILISARSRREKTCSMKLDSSITVHQKRLLFIFNVRLHYNDPKEHMFARHLFYEVTKPYLNCQCQSNQMKWNELYYIILCYFHSFNHLIHLYISMWKQSNDRMTMASWGKKWKWKWNWTKKKNVIQSENIIQLRKLGKMYYGDNNR